MCHMWILRETGLALRQGVPSRLVCLGRGDELLISFGQRQGPAARQVLGPLRLGSVRSATPFHLCSRVPGEGRGYTCREQHGIRSVLEGGGRPGNDKPGAQRHSKAPARAPSKGAQAMCENEAPQCCLEVPSAEIPCHRGPELVVLPMGGRACRGGAENG